MKRMPNDEHRINLYEGEEHEEETETSLTPYELIKEDLKNTFQPRSLEEFQSYVLGLANLVHEGATLGHINLDLYQDVELRMPDLEDKDLPSSFFNGCGKWNVSMIKYFDGCFTCLVNFNEDLNGWKMDQALSIDFMMAHCPMYSYPVLGWKLNKMISAKATFYGTNLKGKVSDIIRVKNPYHSFSRQTFQNTNVIVEPIRTVL